MPQAAAEDAIYMSQKKITRVHFYSLIVILKGTWQMLQDVLYEKSNGNNWGKLGILHKWISEGSPALIFKFFFIQCN